MGRLVGIAVVIALIAGGAWFVLRPQAQVFGAAASAGTPVEAIADLAADKVGQAVAIDGLIDRECPHSGCWAIIKDKTGEIRIDTKRGGFTLPLKQEGSHLKVEGVLEKTASGDLQISAARAELR